LIRFSICLEEIGISDRETGPKAFGVAPVVSLGRSFRVS
jgi:hypothetical protein